MLWPAVPTWAPRPGSYLTGLTGVLFELPGRLPHLVPSGPIRVITGPAIAWPIIVAHFGSLLHFACYVKLLGGLRDTQKD